MTAEHYKQYSVSNSKTLVYIFNRRIIDNW